MAVLFVAVFSLASSTAHAQKKPDPAIAALLQKVEGATTDTARVNALVALAEEYRYKAPKEGVKRADEAEELAQKIGYARGAASAMLAGAWDEYQSGSLKVAAERFTRAVAALETVGDKAGLSYALGGIVATKADGAGSAAGALATLTRAYSIAQESGDGRAIGRVAFFLGMTNRDAGANDSALAQLSRAYDLLQATDAIRDAGKAARALGSTYATLGRYDEAVSAMQSAVKAAEALGDVASLALAHSAIGRMYSLQRRWSESIEAYGQAAADYLRMGGKSQAGQPLLEIAGIYSNTRQFEKSEAVLDSARALFMETADTSGLCAVEIVSGESAWIRGRNAESIRHFEMALRYAEAVGDKKQQARIVSNMMGPYETMGNVMARRRYAERGLQLAREVGDGQRYRDGMRSMVGIAAAMGDYLAADSFLGEAMQLSRASGIPTEVAETHRTYAYRYVEEGDYPRAIRAAYEALSMLESLRDTSKMVHTHHLLMMAYNGAKEYGQTIKLGAEANALSTASQAGEKSALILQPLSDAYLRRGDYVSMDAVNRERLGILQRGGDTTSKAYAQALEATGIGLYKQGRYAEGLPLLHRALRLREGFDDTTAPAVGLLNLGDAYLALAKEPAYTFVPDSLVPATLEGAAAKSLGYLARALPLMRVKGGRDYTQRALHSLSEAQRLTGDYKSSLANYRAHIDLRDSILNAASIREIARREMEYSFGKQADSIKAASERQQIALQKEQALSALRHEHERADAVARSIAARRSLQNEEELKRLQVEDEQRYTQAANELRRQREAAHAKAEAGNRAAIAAAELRRQKALGTGAITGGALLLAAAVFALIAYRQKRKDAVSIAYEKERSEALLLNILPASVADELKASGGAEAKLHDEVTVLYTDFVNFTGMSQTLPPQQLVHELHECFTAFDAIMEKYGMEKIKTIGDAYLAVAGLPMRSQRHAEKAVQAAIDILAFMEERARTERTFGIRIGVHSGPVVAGIVGVKKFAYDIWGDTVNGAARMEKASEPGRINISQSTYELVEKYYDTERRDNSDAQSAGEAMYFVKPKPVNSAAKDSRTSITAYA